MLSFLRKFVIFCEIPIMHTVAVLWTTWMLLIVLCGTAEYPKCDQQSENTLDCCIVSQGTLRCEQAVCPDGYYKASSTSPCSTSDNSNEDKKGTSQTMAPDLTKESTPVQSEESTAGLTTFEMSSQREDAISKKISLALMTTFHNSLTTFTSETAVTSSSSSLHVHCCQCHPTCLICSGKGPADCLSCAERYEWVSTNTTKRCILTSSTPFDNSKLLLLLTVIALLCSVVGVSIYVFRKRLKMQMRRKYASDIASLTASTHQLPTTSTNLSEGMEWSPDEHENIKRTPEVDEKYSISRAFALLPRENDFQYGPSEVLLKGHDASTTIHVCEEKGYYMPVAVQSQSFPQKESKRDDSLYSQDHNPQLRFPINEIREIKYVRGHSAVAYMSLSSAPDVHYQSIPQEAVYAEIQETDEPIHEVAYPAHSCSSKSFTKSKSSCVTPEFNTTLLPVGNVGILNIFGDSDSLCSVTSGCIPVSFSPGYLSSSFGSLAKAASDYYRVSPRSLSDFMEEEFSLGRSATSSRSSTECVTDLYSDSFLSRPIFSPCWQFSKEFSEKGGVLKAPNSVCLEVTQGAIDGTRIVNIHGALSADFSKVYDTLPLPEDEVIVTPVAEYFAGPHFQFQKQVRIVLPHFLSANLPVNLIHAYEFHTEMGRMQCCRLDLQNMEETTEPGRSSTPDSFFYCRAGEIHVFTSHFSGYFCTVCERACRDFVTPAELKLQAHAKHVLRCNGKREVIVRLDLWDNRLSFRGLQKQTDVAREDRQMVLEVERTLKAVDASTDVGTIEVGASFIPSEQQTSWWDHVSIGGMCECPVDQTVSLRELYPCRRRKIPCSMRWKLRDITEIPPQEEFECGIRVGYVSRQMPEDRVNHDDDDMPMVFMKSPAPVNLSLRRAMVLDDDHPDSAKARGGTTHGSQPELKAVSTKQLEETNVKNLASPSSSPECALWSSDDQKNHKLQKGEAGASRNQVSDSSSANSFSFHHVQSINSLTIHVHGTDVREERNAETPLTAEEIHEAENSPATIQAEQDLLQSLDEHCDVSYPIPASDQ